MKKRIVFLLISVLLLQSFAAMAKEYPQKFWDVSKDHWAFEYIAELVDRGVIKGYDDGTFKPESTVSRAEWAKMMCVAGNLSSNDTAVYFRDTEGHWANVYVNAAKDYITSYNDGSFRPDQAIVREDVTRSLVTLRGYDISNVDYSHISGFKDFDSISNYMKAYVAVAVKNGLINGFEDNTFRGQGTLTRAEAATLLYRAFQKGDVGKVATTPDTPYEAPAVSGNTGSEAATPTTVVDNKEKNPGTETVKQEPEKTEDEPTKTEPVEEPDEDKKPYVIRKLASANLDALVNATIDKENNIYYIDSDEQAIYYISVPSGEKTKFMDIDGFEHIKTDEKGTIVAKYNSFVPEQVYYDKTNDRLLLEGYYQQLTERGKNIQQGDYGFIYDITKKNTEVCWQAGGRQWYIMGAINEDELFMEITDKTYGHGNKSNCYRLSLSSGGKGQPIDKKGYPCGFLTGEDGTEFVKYGNEFYVYSTFSNHIGKYDFLADKVEYQTEDIICGVVGFKDGNYYFWNNYSWSPDNGKIVKYHVKDMMPELLEINTKNDYVEVEDMGNLNNIDHKFFVINEETFVFFDTNMKAFRILEKND